MTRATPPLFALKQALFGAGMPARIKRRAFPPPQFLFFALNARACSHNAKRYKYKRKRYGQVCHSGANPTESLEPPEKPLYLLPPFIEFLVIFPRLLFLPGGSNGHRLRADFQILTLV
jgi:hypothetical protein